MQRFDTDYVKLYVLLFMITAVGRYLELLQMTTIFGISGTDVCSALYCAFTS